MQHSILKLDSLRSRPPDAVEKDPAIHIVQLAELTAPEVK